MLMEVEAKVPAPESVATFENPFEVSLPVKPVRSARRLAHSWPGHGVFPLRRRAAFFLLPGDDSKRLVRHGSSCVHEIRAPFSSSDYSVGMCASQYTPFTVFYSKRGRLCGHVGTLNGKSLERGVIPVKRKTPRAVTRSPGVSLFKDGLPPGSAGNGPPPP